MQTGVRISLLNNQKTSENNNICASGWLELMLTDEILVSPTTSE
jgi:hypothetical protein